MSKTNEQEIFISTVPGFEETLLAEVQEKGFRNPAASMGGVTIMGNWKDVWRANLELRGASRVLVRLGSFPANHLAKLDKKARNFPWADTLRPDTSVRVDVSTKKSRIYHKKAAAERIQKALIDSLGAEISDESDVTLKVRILNDQVTISVDTSGEPLHKRGNKKAVNKAPMRETLASLILRHAGYDGTEPVIDPMCGSGTFVIEAAEIAQNLSPGRNRSFAFEKLATFNKDSFEHVRTLANEQDTDLKFYGYDRDKGAIEISQNNAKNAGISDSCTLKCQAISDLKAPDGKPGLVVINPPYGDRLGKENKLVPLYQTIGNVLKENFTGWRVAIVTSSEKLAGATGLPFEKSPLAFSHGGIKVKLYQTLALSK